MSDKLGPYELNSIIHGDCLEVMPLLPDGVIDVTVTSPPYYGKYDYDDSEGQLGHEDTPEEYIQRMGEIFSQVLRISKPCAVLWLVIGDTFNNYSPVRRGQSERKGYVIPHIRRGLVDGYYEKELLGIPFMVKDELRRVGWAWRSCNIWNKPSAANDTPFDRPAITHEYILQFVKPDRRRRLHPASESAPNSVWSFAPAGVKGFPAAYPLELAAFLLSMSKGSLVLDPFGGSATTATAAIKLGWDWLCIEKVSTYVEVGRNRVAERLSQPFLPGMVEAAKPESIQLEFGG